MTNEAFERKIPMSGKVKGQQLYKQYEFVPSAEIQSRINALLSDIVAEFESKWPMVSDVKVNGIPAYRRVSDF
jgi:hypothetical protein